MTTEFLCRAERRRRARAEGRVTVEKARLQAEAERLRAEIARQRAKALRLEAEIEAMRREALAEFDALSPAERSESLLSLQRWGLIEIQEQPDEHGLLPEVIHVRSAYSANEFLRIMADLDPNDPATWPRSTDRGGA